jgi:tetratricopeptide (TPR) repeat protein
MKKLALMAIGAFALNVAVAQTSVRTNAILYTNQQKFDKAKEEIDKAILHPKTATDAKTWYYRGLIYQSLIGHPVYGKLAANAPQVSYESYSKAIEFDKKGGEWATKATKAQKDLYASAFNAAVNAYTDKNYDLALTNYEMAMKINPQDTTAVIYAAYAATEKKDFKQAKQYYNQVLGMGHKTMNIYKPLIYIALEEDKDNNEAMRLLTDARAIYPNDKYLMEEELRLYLVTGRGAEAISKLDAAIKASANDPKAASNLYAIMGDLQNKNKNQEAALTAYTKAVELDPTNFGANFNLGVFQFNKGAELYTTVAKMDYSTYTKKGKAMEAQGKKSFEKALPYFEKAHQLDPKDKDTMKSMEKIYMQLGRPADAERMRKGLEAK